MVTGASTGIGAAAVERLARDGFVVYAGVRNAADAERAAAVHPNVRALVFDVTDRSAIDVAAQAVAAGGAILRGVVNNAGVAVAGPLEFLPVDNVRRQFEINVFGAIAVAQAFLPQLRAARGRLVFIGSISGRLAIPYIAPYSASKFALRAVADAWRVELAAAGIAVTLIEPGSIKTPIWSKGRASRGALVAALGPTAMTYYGPAIEALFRRTDAEERNGLAVERVSAAIARALTARRPPSNDLIGFPARAGSLIALLPARLRDRLFGA